MIEQQDRLRGIIVGAAIGDALGMPLEFHPPRDLYHLVTEMQKGSLPAGCFTDDTEMALCLAESLQYSDPLDPNDLVGRFIGWFQSRPADVGVHTANVLRSIIKGTSWKEAAKKLQKVEPDSASNGALMRCWPLAVARYNNPALLIAETNLQAQITHIHPDSVNAAVFVNLVIQKIVQTSGGSANAAIRQAVADTLDQISLSENLRMTIDLAPVRSRDSLKNTGWVLHTVESALWATHTTQSFEEALVQAVNLGNDADTTGCVTGAIAGALYGLQGIPERWKKTIHGEYPLRSGRLWFLQDFIDLADKLVQSKSNN